MAKTTGGPWVVRRTDRPTDTTYRPRRFWVGVLDFLTGGGTGGRSLGAFCPAGSLPAFPLL